MISEKSLKQSKFGLIKIYTSLPGEGGVNFVVNHLSVVAPEAVPFFVETQ